MAPITSGAYNNSDFISDHYDTWYATDFNDFLIITRGNYIDVNDAPIIIQPRFMNTIEGFTSTVKGRFTGFNDLYIKIKGGISEPIDKPIIIQPRFMDYAHLSRGSTAGAFWVADFNEDFDIWKEIMVDELLFKVRGSNIFTNTEQVFRILPQLGGGAMLDPALNIMLILKNNWNLTESGTSGSDITFSTGWYDDNLALPQITVTPAYNRKDILSIGQSPTYEFLNTLHINIWVRSETDSERSLGRAKHIEYKLRREVERILRSKSHIGTYRNNEEFMYLGRWRKMDEIGTRHVILRSIYEIKDIFFKEHYEEEV